MRISVYITSYNQKEYLKQAVESVFAQTRPADELIIIDDCSTDGSVQLIESYCREFPDLIKAQLNEVNLGITECRNLALSLVSGDLVSWLDGDDSYLPNKLKEQEAALIDEQLDLVYSNFYFAKDQLDNHVRLWYQNKEELPEGPNIFPEVMGRLFPGKTLFRYELVRRELLLAAGGYDQDLSIYEDFDFRIRLSKLAKVGFVDKPLSVYRIHGQGLSRAGRKVHWDTLNYIVSKYKEDIAQLDGPDKERVEEGIANFLKPYYKEPYKPSLWKRIRTKIANMLNLRR